MKAESLLLSDVITHTSHSSIILLGLSVCVCEICEWETEKGCMYMKEQGQECGRTQGWVCTVHVKRRKRREDGVNRIMNRS